MMGNRKGRRARRKRRARASREDSVRTVSLCHESQFVELRQWLKELGFSSESLIPALFSDTGRGLMTIKRIQAGDLIISVPEKCLLSTVTVLRSYLGEYIMRWKPNISPLLALCTFLIAERHQDSRSKWKPYIDILPKSYTCPVYFSERVMYLLPERLRKKAQEQREQVLELHITNQGFFRSLQSVFLQPVEDIFTHEAMCWAWCAVNSRTVYMEQAWSPHLSTGPDVYAMVPYLDLLNHSPNVQVEAGFNPLSRCYEVRSLQGCRRFTQTFICYGPHDSQHLLLNYGFVAPSNPHRVVYVELGTLKQYTSDVSKQLARKLEFLKEQDFSENLTFGPDGPSWMLMTALRLLALKPDQYACWKTVLLGAVVNQETEERSVQFARQVCQQLLEENTKALETLSLLRVDADVSLSEQLNLVEQLRYEEQRILVLSLDVLGDVTGTKKAG